MALLRLCGKNTVNTVLRAIDKTSKTACFGCSNWLLKSKPLNEAKSYAYVGAHGDRCSRCVVCARNCSNGRRRCFGSTPGDRVLTVWTLCPFCCAVGCRPACHSSTMLTLKTYAHSMQDEETDLSFADFNTPSAPKRPYTTPLLNDGPTNENAPDLADGGVHFIWSTRPGSRAGSARQALAERSSAANRRPPRLQSLSTRFYQSPLMSIHVRIRGLSQSLTFHRCPVKSRVDRCFGCTLAVPAAGWIK